MGLQWTNMPPNKRMYYVIPIAIDVNGVGPITEWHKVHDVTYEVWDQLFLSYFSTDSLPEAIKECEKLNSLYYA